jgi:ABC-type transport system involved in multi-copper enzyme maturation permease subunit
LTSILASAPRALVVARRELSAYVRSPVAYLVATLFLLVQGYSFWLFVSLLSERAAPHAWPLRYFFGGSFLFWLFVMFIAAVITMRLVAEERRQGTIEPLLTAPVSAADVILGKYLGALGFYTALWAPTLVYVMHLDRLAPAGQGLDPGPVLAAYFGTWLVGASALAIGLLASTLTQHQLLAAVLGFLALLMLLLIGGAADTAIPGSLTRTVLERMSLFRQMEDFARGVVDTRPLVYHFGLILLTLWTAARWLDRPAQDPASRRRAVLEVLVLLVVVLLGNVLAARHYRRLDFTRAGANTLSLRTTEILAALPAPVTAYVLMLPTGQPEDVYPLVRDLLQLYQARTPRFRVDFIDVDREADRVRTLAEHFGMSGDDLQEGAVVFELKGPDGTPRTRYVPRRDLVESEIDPDGVPHLKTFKGEAAFDGALVGISEARRPLVCFTRGHGELQIDSLTVDGMSDLGQALGRANFQLRTLPGIETGVPAECNVTVVAGPERPFTPGELAALDALLGRGGRLLVLMGPVLDASLHPAPTGLEALLGRWGVEPNDGVVFDPAVEMSTSVLGWAVDEGYGDHPITTPLVGRRTVWAVARALTPRPRPGEASRPGLRVTELLRTGEKSWEEHNLDTVFRDPRNLRYDEDHDRRGPLAVALAVEAQVETQGARLVVLGSKALARNDHDVYFNRDLLELSVVWLGGTRREVTVAPQAFTQFKLALDAGQLGRVWWVSVVALPLLCLFLGAGVWWRRRA